MTKRRMSLRRNQTNLKTERHEGRRCVHNAGDGRHGKLRSFTDSWDLRLGMEQQSVVMVNKGMVYASVFCLDKSSHPESSWKKGSRLCLPARSIDTLCVFA